MGIEGVCCIPAAGSWQPLVRDTFWSPFAHFPAPQSDQRNAPRPEYNPNHTQKQQQVKSFAAASVGAPAPGYPSPPYKLLILDEADSMTQDAQNALRRTMEQYSKVAAVGC